MNIPVNMYPDCRGQCVSIAALVCKATETTSFILFQTQEECGIQRPSRGSVGRGWCLVYPVCIIRDYTCQGTVNKDSVHLRHTVLDPAAISVSE